MAHSYTLAGIGEWPATARKRIRMRADLMSAGVRGGGFAAPNSSPYRGTFVLESDRRGRRIELEAPRHAASGGPSTLIQGSITAWYTTPSLPKPSGSTGSNTRSTGCWYIPNRMPT
ncbi:hypothetical protein GCM10009750_35150 [Agromyces salentinus]|uniref:Uncharacterized protein n=1 Tax=Agromyces salentinus TaxID=269421 RepID=A0ABN2N1K3_9MICO